MLWNVVEFCTLLLLYLFLFIFIYLTRVQKAKAYRFITYKNTRYKKKHGELYIHISTKELNELLQQIPNYIETYMTLV